MSRHLERLTAVAVAPNARAVAAAGFRDKKDAPPVLLEGISASIHVFQIGKSVKEGYEGALGDRQVCSLAFGETRLYAGTEDGSILSFDPSSDDRAPTAERRGTAAVSALVVHGNRLYAADVEGFVRTFAATTLEPGPSRRVAEGAQASLTVGHDHLIVGGTDGVARALPLDALDGDLREMPLSTAAVTALTTTEDGRVLAGLADGTVFLCFLEGAVDAEERSAGAPHENTVHGIALLPRLEDEKGQKLPARFLSLSEDGALKSWELDSKRRPKTSQTSAGAAGLALLPPTKTMRSQHKAGIAAVVSGERTLHLFELDAQGNAAPFHKALSRFSELGQSLRARAANVREAAVRELGALPEDYARTQLERVLGSDRDASIRAFTASVLGEGMRRLSRPALQKALSESNPDVRAAAFASLRQIDVDAPLSPVRAALLSSHWDVRAEAVELLPSLRSASPLVPGLIADALRDGEAKVRDQAFEALFALDAPGSLEPIVTAMRHGPEDVRVQALIRLAGLLQPDSTSKSHDGRDILERALDDDADTVRKTAFFVAVALQSALAGGLSIRDPEARKALAKIAHQAGVPVGSAGPELTDHDKQPLFAALAARSSDSALLGARALGILGDRRAPGALLSLSREPDVALRRRVVDAIEAAAYALPEDERLVAHLEWLLDDDDAQTRQRAFDALDRIGAPAGPAAALELAGLALRCKFYDIRLRALPILTGFGGRGKWAGLSQLSRRADELLSDGLDDEREKVRSEAFRTLWSWHEKAPREPLERAAGSRHPDIRSRAASELGRIKDTWADELLIVLARDTDATVGLTAFETFRKKSKEHDNDVRIFLALLQSPRPELKARATREVPAALRDEVLSTIVALVRDDHPTVHIAAIEAVDRLKPDDITAFQEAFASVFYRLRVRAGELLGKRRDERAIAPMEALLSIPKEDIRYPSEELRRKAAAALADVGARKTLSFLTALLEEDDGYINEQGARGLATAARPGDERVLLDALDHKELAVRSWAAEGLARLGDVRAIPVLAGSLAHDHRPIRLGAILGYVALGADGVRGILAGLDDGDREIADLCFAVVVARDLGLRRAELPPDLLLSVLGSAEPELRFSAARLLEAREDLETLESIASGLVGPATPARAADMKNWPKEPRRVALTRIVVDALGSDHPAQRYAATQVLALRKKPLAFWREAARLQGPALSPNLRIPHTNWDLEPAQPQKRGWVRRLFSRPERAPAEPGTGRVLEVISFIGGRTARAVPEGDAPFREHQRLAYGTYVGLLRQAPATGESDVTHKVRRDSIARLSALASTEIGQDVVLPVLRQSLNDPNHLVRRAAIAALTEMYPDEKDSLIPLLLMLKSSAADVGKAAVDGLIGKALDGNEHARRHAQRAVDAPVADVRKHALGMLPRLFETGSAEPFVLALGSGYADLRLLVVDRLVDSTDDRVKDALTRALSSTDEDLRLKAAAALARRGDDSTVDVLAGLLRSERGAVASHATEALVALAHARPDAEELTAVRAKAAEAIAQRLTDDPDQTADKGRLIDALGRIRSAAGAPALLAFADGEEAGWRKKSVDALMNIALDRATPPLQLRDGTRRARYQERLLLEWLVTLSESKFEELRVRTARILRDVDDRAAESILAALLLDRSEAVRTAACEALAFRAEVVEGASLDALAQTLRGGQRELVLPAATGLAARQRPEAFQALLLVFKAGTQDERLRAVLALGNLGDVRALEEFRPFVDPTAVLEPEDQALSPTVGRAYGRMLRHLPADATERSEVRETLDRLATETIGAIRLTALTGLREAGDEHSRALLERTAGDPAEQVPLRRHALQELAIFGHPGSEPLLVELLTDRNVSNDALAALERLFPADRTRTRLHMLKSANTTYQQRAAAYLTQHGRAETLVEALGQIDDALVRATLRRGLLRRGSGTPPSKGAEGTFGKDALRTLLTSEKPGPREDAAILAAVEPEVGRSLSNELGAAISKALAGLKARRDVDEDRALRAGLRAATALELAQLAPAREALNLDRASPDLRRAAIEHLAALGDASDRDRVQNGVLDLDPVVRQIAGAALAKREAGSDLLRAPVVDAVALRPVVAAEKARDESSLYSSPRTRQITLPVVFADRDAPGLVEAAEDKGSDRRLPAIDALGRLASEAAEQTLQAIFTDEQEEANIRKAAFRSLRRHQRRRARLERGHAS